MTDDSKHSLLAIDQPISDAAMAGSADSSPELLGAIDIVEAFTILRHELKLQVRSGRELQESLVTGLQHIEQRLGPQNQGQNSQSASEARKLVEAIIDIEESLRRAVDSLTNFMANKPSDSILMTQFNESVAKSSWLIRKLAGKLLLSIRASIEKTSTEIAQAEKSLRSTQQGCELLLARVHRQMKQCDIDRVDVHRQPFDAELMNAIDVIDSDSVPATHVAEQIRPAYRWRGEILRYAEVRLAK